MKQIIEFFIESEKLKTVERATSPIGLLRYENSAEHSWSVALMAMVLIDQIDPELDKLKVIEMLLVHDLVEIDAGDNFCYGDHDKKELEEAEARAAKRIFGLLPEKEAKRLINLWEEFEGKSSGESLFANALDRFIPTIQNFNNEGGTWKKHKIRKDQFLERNKLVQENFPTFWKYDEMILSKAIDNGWISKGSESVD